MINKIIFILAVFLGFVAADVKNHIQNNNINNNVLNTSNKSETLNGFIYEGGWPFNKDKDLLNKNGFSSNCPGDISCECVIDKDCKNNNCMRYPRGSYCSPTKGTVLPRFQMIDQFGQLVDIYDFAGHNKYILIELSAAWCKPCNQLSSWLTYNDLECTRQVWWKSDYVKIKSLIESGEVIMINIQYGDKFRDNASLLSIQDWFSRYPHEQIPVLADSDKLLHSWLKPTGIPTIILLNDKMEIIQPASRGLNDAFDKLLDIF